MITAEWYAKEISKNSKRIDELNAAWKEATFASTQYPIAVKANKLRRENKKYEHKLSKLNSR